MEKQGRSGILFRRFKEHVKIRLDICAGTCYNIVRKCGHRTSASISAFQAEEVGSIPIARSIQKRRWFVQNQRRFSCIDITFYPTLAFYLQKNLQDPKRKEPGGCLPAASRLDFFLIPDMAKGESSAFAMEIEEIFTLR